MAVTLKDVAREAGVALSTASRVLQGEPHPMVSAGTRERVLGAARQLNYRHNTYARHLRLGRSETIGILAFDLGTGIALSRLQAIERAVAAKGYRTLLRHAAGHVDAEIPAVKDFAGGLVDGAIILSHSPETSAETLGPLVERGVPCVSLEPLDGLVDCVVLDLRAGGHEAATHLLSLGHQRIGAILGTRCYATAERLRGYHDAALAYGHPLDDLLLEHVVERPDESVYDRGYEAAKRLLARSRPTALLCNNDEIAIGAMKAIAETGLRIPDDIALVGFDDIPVSSYISVPLTTLAQPTVEQVGRAVDLLLTRIQSPGPGEPARTIPVAPRLIVRASSGAARPPAPG